MRLPSALLHLVFFQHLFFSDIANFLPSLIFILLFPLVPPYHVFRFLPNLFWAVFLLQHFRRPLTLFIFLLNLVLLRPILRRCPHRCHCLQPSNVFSLFLPDARLFAPTVQPLSIPADLPTLPASNPFHPLLPTAICQKVKANFFLSSLLFACTLRRSREIDAQFEKFAGVPFRGLGRV